MVRTSLHELLEQNARHTSAVSEEYFDNEQRPAAVAVCCVDTPVPQERIWDIDQPGLLYTPSTVGNQVWARQDGELVVDRSVLYSIIETDTDTTITLLIGHTGCHAIKQGLKAVEEGSDEQTDEWEGLLKSVVEEGLDDDRVNRTREESLINQLVEYNIDRQIAFLQESNSVPDTETLYGFVYDFHGVYGETRGRAYLINANGQTSVDALRSLVPDNYPGYVARLL